MVAYILGILRNFSGIWKHLWMLFTSGALLGTQQHDNKKPKYLLFLKSQNKLMGLNRTFIL